MQYLKLRACTPMFHLNSMDLSTSARSSSAPLPLFPHSSGLVLNMTYSQRGVPFIERFSRQGLSERATPLARVERDSSRPSTNPFEITRRSTILTAKTNERLAVAHAFPRLQSIDNPFISCATNSQSSNHGMNYESGSSLSVSVELTRIPS